MKKCVCGKEVRLRAVKCPRPKGVINWIEHMDGTPVCVPGDWECRMWKPYPKTSHEYPSWGMMARWDAGPEPQP